MELIDQEREVMRQTVVTTPLWVNPTNPLVSVCYVWSAYDPGGGEYRMLQGHHPIFRTNDPEEILVAYSNWKDHLQ